MIVGGEWQAVDRPRMADDLPSNGWPIMGVSPVVPHKFSTNHKGLVGSTKKPWHCSKMVEFSYAVPYPAATKPVLGNPKVFPCTGGQMQGGYMNCGCIRHLLLLCLWFNMINSGWFKVALVSPSYLQIALLHLSVGWILCSQSQVVSSVTHSVGWLAAPFRETAWAWFYDMLQS